MAQQSVRPEDEPGRKAGAIKVFSLGLSAGVVVGEIMGVIIWLIGRNFPIVPTTLILAVVLVMSLLSYWMARAGWARFAGYFFIVTFLLESAVITLLFGGATGPLAYIYIFPILVSGIVIGINYSFLTATLAAALYLGMIPVGQTGIIVPLVGPAGQEPIVPLFIGILVLYFYLVAFLGWYASKSLNSALETTRLYASNLQTANEKLQASEEELRASNEELEASNEELRSTEEELRTSNEELEVTNEELREAQEQLVRSEKLAAIGQLAGGVGHELRNPLGAIKNAVYYIRGKVAKSEMAQQEPRVMEFLDIVDEEINSSNKIINDLLSFSRVGKPAVSPVRIEKVVDDAVAHIPIPENIEFAKELDNSLPEVEMDTDQIRQVLVNMMTNALQAMPEGGKLTIGARTVDNSLQVEITDTGVGIAKENIGKIFDPLYTMKAKGIGLGLAVCRSIIERHQGHIEVKSRVGKGTTFTIKLPLKAG